jgi:hypothetical protein
MRILPEQAAEAISLHNRMMQLLAQMATLPYGSTMNYNASGGGRSSEHPGGRRPGGEARSVEDEFRARWQGCRTIRAARLVVEEAAAELDHWRHSKAQDAGETQKQLYLRIVRVGEGWPDREAAASLRQSMKTVHAAREAHGRDFAKGLVIAGASEAELLRRGNSVRQVAAMLRVSKSSVFDRTRKAA